MYIMECSQGEVQVFDALDEFIAAVEETKEILQSPTVPGRSESADIFLENDTVRDLRSFSKRPSHSEGDLRFCHKPKRLSLDETDYYYDKMRVQEKKAAGLVGEMNTLLNQLSSAASSLKDIYKRRSSTDMVGH